jgi:hypothetical protein
MWAVQPRTNHAPAAFQMFPQTVEMAMDLLEFQIQRLAEQYGRAITVAVPRWGIASLKIQQIRQSQPRDLD